jgi:hypothetical protein
MSAASRKKHSNAHKGFQAGDDQLEVSSLIAGAGNGRDVEQRLGRTIDAVTNLPTNEEGLVNADDLVKAGDELNRALKEISDSTPNTEKKGLDLQRSIETSLAASNVTDFEVTGDEPTTELTVTDGAGVIAKPAFEPEGVIETEWRKVLYVGKNLIAIMVRGVRDDLFGEGYSAELKRVVEVEPYAITGLTTGFKLADYSKTQKRMTMKESQACISLLERHGRWIDKLLHRWAVRYNDYLIDAESAAGNRAYKPKITEDDVTIDVLFIEPDHSGTKVLTAWKGTNLLPSNYTGLESFLHTDGRRSDDEPVKFDLAGNYARSEKIDEEAQAALDAVFEASLTKA